jgi:hypothetical protein
MNHPKSRTIIRFLALAIKVAAAQSSRLAEFGGRGMSFNICHGTLGSLAMFTAIRNASSRMSSFADFIWSALRVLCGGGRAIVVG